MFQQCVVLFLWLGLLSTQTLQANKDDAFNVSKVDNHTKSYNLIPVYNIIQTMWTHAYVQLVKILHSMSQDAA